MTSFFKYYLYFVILFVSLIILSFCSLSSSTKFLSKPKLLKIVKDILIAEIIKNLKLRTIQTVGTFHWEPVKCDTCNLKILKTRIGDFVTQEGVIELLCLKHDDLHQSSSLH